MDERFQKYGVLISIALLVGLLVGIVWLTVLYLIFSGFSTTIFVVSIGCGIIGSLYHLIYWRRHLKREGRL